MKYGTLGQQEKLFRSCLGRNWLDGFERYKRHEYPMGCEITEHLDRYKSLPESVRISFKKKDFQ